MKSISYTVMVKRIEAPPLGRERGIWLVKNVLHGETGSEGGSFQHWLFGEIRVIRSLNDTLDLIMVFDLGRAFRRSL